MSGMTPDGVLVIGIVLGAILGTVVNLAARMGKGGS